MSYSKKHDDLFASNSFTRAMGLAVMGILSVGRVTGRHWTLSNPTCFSAKLLEKIFNCIIYRSIKVDLCKLKNIVFLNCGDLNIGKAECEAGPL